MAFNPHKTIMEAPVDDRADFQQENPPAKESNSHNAQPAPQAPRFGPAQNTAPTSQAPRFGPAQNTAPTPQAPRVSPAQNAVPAPQAPRFGPAQNTVPAPQAPRFGSPQNAAPTPQASPAQSSPTKPTTPRFGVRGQNHEPKPQGQPVTGFTAYDKPQPQRPVVQPTAIPAKINEDNVSDMVFNGIKVGDLQASGFHVLSLLKVASTSTVQKKVRFNVPLLETLPLDFVLLEFGGEQVAENIFKYNDEEISLQGNKWYNRSQRRGQVNAISLTKHLIASYENKKFGEKIDENADNRRLFLAACEFLSDIEPYLHNGQARNPASRQQSQEASPVDNGADHPQLPEKPAQRPANYVKVDWKALTEKLNAIPMADVLEMVGANPNEDGQRGKWKIWQTGHNIQLTDQNWYSWNKVGGGVGPISFLAYHLGIVHSIDDRIDENKKLLRKMAIEELVKHFGEHYEIDHVSGKVGEMHFKEPFCMPHVIDFKINAVREYLHEKRGLPMWVINKQIESGFLFAGHPSDWREQPLLKNPEKLGNDKVWATFLAVNGNAAEMRAIELTGPLAKLLAKGSDKDAGGFLIKAEKDFNERTVVALEAAIDSMSYHSIYPGRIATSCMGVNFNLALKVALEALENGFNFELAFDNDQAGNEAAVRFKEQLINEIGEEDYEQYIQDNQISYFNLGIRCLRKSIEQDLTYYFDVHNNEIGMNAVKMFQEQLFKEVPREEVKQWLAQGKIRYINVEPSYGLITNVQQEAQETLKLLLSNKPYYLTLRDHSEDNPEVRHKAQEFRKVFMELAKPHWEHLQSTGIVISEKKAIAKDWNEYFIMSKEEPELANHLANIEHQLAHYNEVKPSKKKCKMN